MIAPDHPLPVAAQCRLLRISRGCVYYRPVPISKADLRLMRRLDELHLEYPFFGSRRLQVKLDEEGLSVGRRHLVTLMRRMGIEALYRKPRTSLGNRQHPVYPYLLKDLAIVRPNQVWSADITYVPMAQGFGYLVAILDVFSRKVLAHRLSNTMTTDFCVEALQEALVRHGTPEIFNTDQGAQFTDTEFTGTLKAHAIATGAERSRSISMDGKGRWVDNVFIERLWRSVKYEEVYLKAYASLTEARQALAAYFTMYNTRRPHQSLDYQTPDVVYFQRLAPARWAA
jgi:putative transposase